VRTLVALVGLVACGGAQAPAPAAAPEAPARGATRPAADSRVPVDPIAALAPVDGAEVSWLAPGAAQLELDGATFDSPGSARPIEVSIIDRHGSKVRVALRLPHARFSLWTSSNRLFAVMRKDHRVSSPFGDAFALVRAGARVKRLAHEGKRTQIRYSGALEVEGWVPDEVLGESGPPHEYRGRFPSGRRTLMVTPGAVIRAKPEWAAEELAVMANGYFLDTRKELAEGWTEVSYDDGDLSVHGFVSKRLPPGQVHRPHSDPETQPVPVTPNAKVASGTCLYARVKGDAVGYIVGEREVDLADGETGWFSLALDTPWGPIAFAARGPTRSDLMKCGPATSAP
jgi:hypothetical protein